MQEQIQQLTRRIEALENENRLLKSSNTIPLEIDQAFRDRFLSGVTQAIVADSKSASSENQAVNEGGVATYNVLKPPDGFVSTVLNGATIYIPYFT